MAKIWRIAGSRRFAIILLAALAAILLIGSAVPNLDLMDAVERRELAFRSPTWYKLVGVLQLRAIAGHPFFLLWPFFLFISVLSCTSVRIKPFLASRKRIWDGSELLGDLERETSLPASELIARAEKYFSNDGWATTSLESAATIALRAEKGRDGFWGSIAFHLGMLFLLVGVAWSMVLAFRGTVLITEGQTIDISSRAHYLNYSMNSFFFNFMPSGSVALDKFNADFNDDGEAVAFKLDVTITDENRETHAGNIVVNGPAKIGGTALTFHKYGFSPYFVVSDKDGKTLMDANVRLNVFTPEDVDSFTIIALPPRKLNLRFFPDHVDNNGNVSTRSLKPANPAFIVWFDGSDKKGFVKLGQTIELEGYKINFANLNYWAYLDVVNDPAMPAMILGFIVVVFGLAWRFYRHERKVVMTATDGDVTIVKLGGRSAYFPALFEDELKIALDRILETRQ